MDSKYYAAALRRMMLGEINLSTDDIRVALLMTDSTAGSDSSGINNISDITTLDEYDDTGYSRLAFVNKSVTETATPLAKFDADDLSFTGLTGDPSRKARSALIYKHVDGTAGNDIPIAHVRFGFDLPTTSDEINIPWDADGILTLSS